jgi:hypothetical protein
MHMQLHKPMAYDPHKRQNYSPTNNVWTFTKQKTIAKASFFIVL